ncbi:CTP synthase family protein [Zea mays]|uniref:CTP synthase n=1 Tax=Zea mays TaxID=4577 RepID=A0A1D6MXC7_MAIZE|nr:CTP synthase family protein [Zea mays]
MSSPSPSPPAPAEEEGRAPTKYVLITGGVVSGLGKGVTASSIGVVLKACGLRVTCIKIDPYLNTDAGTMSPFEHGEVFVLDDGGEVDLDLGNYERFIDVTLTRDNNITTGKIYQSVIEKERRGDYLGKTVQVIPHVTDEIKQWIQSVSSVPVDGQTRPADVCVIELGGTVGDIESMPFIEALRQLSFSLGKENFCLIHVSLVPVLGVVGEQKTKPTQHSVRELRALGLTPDLLACRSAQPLIGSVKEKLSQFCHVPVENILNIHDVPNLWHVPLILRNQKAHEAIIKQLNLARSAGPPELRDWTDMAESYDNLNNSVSVVKVALVGKYTNLTDSYLSVVKALLHASVACSLKPSIQWIAASDLEDATAISLHSISSYYIACPFFVYVTASRDDNFFNRHQMPMLKPGKLLKYGSPPHVDERHRHRYEVNPSFVPMLESAGLHFVGCDESRNRMEIVELQDHPFYVGVQFHPEFKSRPRRPSPPFTDGDLPLLQTPKLFLVHIRCTGKQSKPEAECFSLSTT